MPVLWRYLINHFLKVAIVCVLAFIAILLTMRLDEIAHFAALGAPLHYILFFTAAQIPYILPIAIPLSCLIASLLLMQRLSFTHELTALRACGFSIGDILAPVLLTAFFLSTINFWIASELATQSHLASNRLKSELRSINPLLLLNNKHLMRLQGFYFEAFGPARVGESASEVVLAFPNKHNERLSLMIAQHLRASPTVFVGQGVTLITGSEGNQENDFDNLLVENMGESVTLVHDFSDILQRKVWTVNNDYLRLPLLQAHIREQRQLLKQAEEQGEGHEQLAMLRSQINRSLSEITKRLSIALAVFSFTLMGAAFGISIGRKRQYKAIYLAIALTALYVISFFAAKGLEHHRELSTLLYFTPQALIIAASTVLLRRIGKGVESC